MKAADESERKFLRRIANALGVPVERFYADTLLPEAAATSDEFLSLWSKITTEEGRRRALEALRVIVESEQS